MTRKAFTLIELLVVVAVLALLASIVFSNLGGAREGARISNALSFQSQTHSLLGSDLVGWWNFDDSSNRYKDLSGYGNNGSCTSCPTVSDGVPGTGGNALEFDGVGDYVNIGNISIFQTFDKMTLGSWVYPTGFTTYSSILGKGTPYYYGIRDNGGLLYLRHSDLSEPWTNVSLASPIVTQKWYHVIATWDGGNVRLYLNGEYVGGQSNLSGTISAMTDNLGIGSYRANTEPNHMFPGFIDDVRIYSRALTASEVQGLYAQTKDKYLAND